MLNIGIIGLGDVSSMHINAIEKSHVAKITAICDIDNKLAKKYPQYKFYSDYKEMIKKGSFDCIHICLPHYLHLEVTKYCVENNINVLLEKPLGLNYEECLELIVLEEKYDSKICVCFQNRINKTFQVMLSLMKNNYYGKIKGIKALVTWSRDEEYYSSKPWRKTIEHAGSGAMLSQAIHTIDLMQLIGGEVNSVKGIVGNLLDYDIEVEDTAVAQLEFKNGAKGFMLATVASVSNSTIELQVILEKGKLTIKDNILYEVNENGEKIKIIEDDRLEGKKAYYGLGHKNFIENYYEAILSKSKNYVSTKEGAKVVRIIDAIVKSNKDGKRIKL